MKKNCIFSLKSDTKDFLIRKYCLHECITNTRTSIYENVDSRFSFDSKVVRVTIFDENNYKLHEELKEFFYGKEYAAI